MCAALERLLRATALQVETFDTAPALLARLDQDRPNCLVLGLGAHELVGLEVLERFQARGDRIAVVFVSAPAEVACSVRAMKDGAVDVLPRPVDFGALLAAVMRGLAMDAEWRETRERVAAAAHRLGALTPREREVCDLVATGKPNKRIAVELGTSEKTVKVHRGRVMHKLRASSVVDLVHLLEQVGLSPA